MKYKLQIEAPGFGQTFNLELSPSPKLTSSDFVVLETYANGSVPAKFKDEDFECYFRGSNTALSLCQGLVSNNILYNVSICICLKI